MATYQILIWAFLIATAVTPVFYCHPLGPLIPASGRDFETARLETLAAVLIWLVLTLAMTLLHAFVAYVVGHAVSHQPSATPHTTASYVAIHVIYLAACYLLIDWGISTRGRPDHGPNL
jgi:hypothetical protein